MQHCIGRRDIDAIAVHVLDPRRQPKSNATLSRLSRVYLNSCVKKWREISRRKYSKPYMTLNVVRRMLFKDMITRAYHNILATNQRCKCMRKICINLPSSFASIRGMHVGEMGLPDRGIIDKPNKVET